MAAIKDLDKAKKAENEKEAEGDAKLSAKDYERELARLHGELVKLQLWVVAKGLKVVVLFEGRDGAGKGGVIKAITERVSPRVYRVVALPAPTDREKSQMCGQRYMRHLPAAGEIVIFDRSWYNRAGVERVMEFCTPEQVKGFLEVTPEFEKTMVDSEVRRERAARQPDFIQRSLEPLQSAVNHFRMRINRSAPDRLARLVDHTDRRSLAANVQSCKHSHRCSPFVAHESPAKGLPDAGEEQPHVRYVLVLGRIARLRGSLREGPESAP
jgi:hypothetical protein